MVPERKAKSSTNTALHDTKNLTHKKKKAVAPQENDQLFGPERSAKAVAALKSRIREMGPICKSRKKTERDSPLSKQVEEDAYFDRLFNMEGQANHHESFWLSSESLSPLYRAGDFMFMGPCDYSIFHERLTSLLSSWVDCGLFPDMRISFFDGATANPIKEASLALKETLPEHCMEEEAGNWLWDPVEGVIDSSCEKSCCDFSTSQENSSTTLSISSESSSLFWDLDRTDMWVSLINLDGEDSKLIPNLESDSENLESNFPSPTYGISDVHSSDFELSSELLSGFLDLDDMDFDEPLMWPFEDKDGWSSTWDFFCESPYRALGTSSILLKADGRKGHSKNCWKRRFVVGSSLSASKLVEFKRGSRRITIASRSAKVNHSRCSRSAGSSMKMMPSASKHPILGLLDKKRKFGKNINLVLSAKRLEAMSVVDNDKFDLNGEDSQWISELEADCEEGLKSNLPSPCYNNRGNQALFPTELGFSLEDELFLEILSESTCWDQMDLDEPLFWPYDKDQNWTLVWDSFSVSPRRGSLGMAIQRGGCILENLSSIRVRMHDKRAGSKRSLVGGSSLSASKIIGFKRGYGKKGNARRVKSMNSRFGKSGARNFTRVAPQKMDVITENEDKEVLGV